MLSSRIRILITNLKRLAGITPDSPPDIRKRPHVSHSSAPATISDPMIDPSLKSSGKRRRRKPSSKPAGTGAVIVAPSLLISSTVLAEDRELRDTDFVGLGLDRRIVAAVDDLGFSGCTPVQAQTLPPALAGRDVAGKAQTGTGKTAAFLITILERFLKDTAQRPTNAPFSLILAPTRELAIQIAKDAAFFAKYTGMRYMAVYGGMDYKEQQTAIQAGVDLLVATPGRLLDFTQQRLIDLSQVQVLVIDEADRMLDMGFIPDVRRILRMLPPPEARQNLLFSATLSPEIMNLASQWMREPVTVHIEPERVVPVEVEQIVYAVAARDKLGLLLWILNNDGAERVLVFRNRRDSSELLAQQLMHYGVHCALLSGDVPQKKRVSVLEAFRQGAIKVIVATDVAGRGIHVDNISHVVNYDLPYEPEDYIHRIGRTGRAGETGKAVSFACEESGFVIPEIEECIKSPLPIRHPESEMLKLPHPQPMLGGQQHTDLLPRKPHGGSRGGGARSGSRGGRGGERGRPRRRTA